MSKIAVRRLLPDDECGPAIDLLTRFFAEEGFTTPPAVIAENTKRMLGIDACGVFVAVNGAETVGIATASLEFGIEFGWSAEIGDLYVLPEWRGQGVAMALFQAVESFLREKGASGCQVTVTPVGQDHHDLRSFYERLGFGGDGRLILRKEF